jgi:hypothetical protein
VTVTLLLEKRPEKTYIGRVERGFDFWVITSGPEDWKYLRCQSGGSPNMLSGFSS